MAADEKSGAGSHALLGVEAPRVDLVDAALDLLDVERRCPLGEKLRPKQQQEAERGCGAPDAPRWPNLQHCAPNPKAAPPRRACRALPQNCRQVITAAGALDTAPPGARGAGRHPRLLCPRVSSRGSAW